MNRVMRVVPWIFVLLALAGCTTTGPHRVFLDRFSNEYPGMSVANFSVEDVDTFVRYFATEKGYDIKFALGGDVQVQQELSGDDTSLLWMAEKKGSPSILFMSSNTRLTVSLVPVQGSSSHREVRDDVNVLYAILKDKFGQGNVHLEEITVTR